MLTLPTDVELESRLYRLARALGKTPEQCALAALKSWIEDHEETQAHARRLGGGEGGGIARLPDDFFD